MEKEITKEGNLLDELFVHEKRYKGFARISKNHSHPLLSNNGQMSVYWDEKLANDFLKKGEAIVKCEILYLIQGEKKKRITNRFLL